MFRAVCVDESCVCVCTRISRRLKRVFALAIFKKKKNIFFIRLFSSGLLFSFLFSFVCRKTFFFFSSDCFFERTTCTNIEYDIYDAWHQFVYIRITIIHTHTHTKHTNRKPGFFFFFFTTDHSSFLGRTYILYVRCAPTVVVPIFQSITYTTVCV